MTTSIDVTRPLKNVLHAIQMAINTIEYGIGFEKKVEKTRQDINYYLHGDLNKNKKINYRNGN